MSKVWLITGSSRGLGRDLAKAVLAAGDRLVATSRNPADVKDIVEKYGDHARAIALDVTKPDAATNAIAEAKAAFGRLDVVVNNAGYANVNSIEDVAEDDFRAQIETNFFGVFNVTRAALPLMREQKSGHIIQISSIGGRGSSPGLAAYQSAKWAVGGLSEVLAKEVAPFGIRVTIVEPGGMRTDWGGSSMRVDELTAGYEQTIGGFAKHVRGNAEIMRTDPVRAANAILKIAGAADAPLRLLLGSDAVFLADLIIRARAAEDAKWKSLSTSTDFPGMIDFAESPIGKMLAGKG